MVYVTREVTSAQAQLVEQAQGVRTEVTAVAEERPCGLERPAAVVSSAIPKFQECDLREVESAGKRQGLGSEWQDGTSLRNQAAVCLGVSPKDRQATRGTVVKATTLVVSKKKDKNVSTILLTIAHHPRHL